MHLEVGNVGDNFQDTSFLRDSKEGFMSCLCNTLGQALVRIERKIDCSTSEVQ